MKQKTYALFDMIGISKALRNGDDGVLQKFWSAADAAVNGDVFSDIQVQTPGQNGATSPDVQIVVFSDSALLTTKVEYAIEDFYKIALMFKEKIERAAGKTYCIVCRGECIEPSTQPVLGGILTRKDNLPRFLIIAGSGTVWVDLWEADKIIKKERIWHENYSLYCVGPESKPDNMQPHDTQDFESFSGEMKTLMALKYKG